MFSGGSRRFITCLIGIGSVVLLFNHLARAETNISPWLTINNPTLAKISDLDSSDIPHSRLGNKDCQIRDVTIRPEKPEIWQSKTIIKSCSVDTGFGVLDSQGNLQRPGSSVAGRVTTFTGQTANLVRIPRTSTAALITGAGFYGGYISFISNVNSGIRTSSIYTGEVTHNLPSAPYSHTIKDKNGRTIEVDYDSISFSADGNWMLASLVNYGFARINTSTFEMTVFGDVANYASASNTNFATAISPDGRYAIYSSFNHRLAKIFDLSTCRLQSQSNIDYSNCSSRNLLPYLNENISNFRTLTSIRFNSNYTINTYLSTSFGGNYFYHQYMMVAYGQEIIGYQYLGIGDSFASGEGAYSYKASTDTSDNKCHLSLRSYPYLISSELGFGQYESVACSGAKIKDIVDEFTNYNNQHYQAKGKQDKTYDIEILTSFLPGYRIQKEFITKYSPNIITVSAVGNDIGFSDIIMRCVDTDTCYSSYEDRIELLNSINTQFYRLTSMYDQLKSAGPPNIKIYAIGYPQIAHTNGNCALNVHLNNDEIKFSNQLISYLNQMIKIAAQNQGVFYVDVEQAFEGNKMCQTDSWNVAVNGLTNGNDMVNLPYIHGPIGNESYHPNAYGHELLKSKILSITDNLSSPMPEPDPTKTMPDPSPSLDILKVPKSNRTIKTIKNITGTNGGVMEVGKTQFMRSPLGMAVSAGSIVKAWINSTPHYIGEFTATQNDDVELNFTLPDSIPSGFHTLHLYTKNTSGEEMDFFMTVFVINGIVGSCQVVQDSEIDLDDDIIDDACDGHIDAPKTTNIIESNDHPKPPKNNPETRAGDEYMLEQASNSQPSTHNPSVTFVNTGQGTIQTQSNSLPEESLPQVAGSSTASSTDQSVNSILDDYNNAKSTSNNKKWLDALIILLALFTIITLTIITKNRYK